MAGKLWEDQEKIGTKNGAAYFTVGKKELFNWINSYHHKIYGSWSLCQRGEIILN